MLKTQNIECQALDLSQRIKEPSPAKPLTVVDIFVQKVREGREEVNQQKVENVRLKSQKYGEVVTSNEVLERMKKVELAKEEKESKKQERGEKRRKDAKDKVVKKGKKKIRKMKTILEEDEFDVDADLEAMEHDDDNNQAQMEGDNGSEDENIMEEEGQKADEVELNKNVKREVNEFVIFSYEGELFPGQIRKINNDGADISSMQRCGLAWKWPDHVDVMSYLWSDVKATIEPIKISKSREIFKIPELD